MSFVSEFLINPVLRQARRFSRSGQPSEHIVLPTSQQNQVESPDDFVVEYVARSREEVEDAGIGTSGSISGIPLTSSPIEEDGGLEAELDTLEAGIPPREPINRGSVHVVPFRMSSLRSEPGQIDNDVSNNPSYGIPSRFRTGSNTSVTFATQSRNNTMGGTIPAESSARGSTLSRTQNGSVSHQRSSSLAEDDGMGLLRQEIVAIQTMDITADQKARMMHQLLTRDYSQAQEISHAKLPLAAPATNLISQERPATPGSLSSYIWQMNGASEDEEENDGNHHTFHLSPDDLKRTYSSVEVEEFDEYGNVTMIRDETQALGCRHYKRNVKLQCSECEKWYTCRLCHDEAEDHILNRKATKNMLCMLCECAQGAGEFCVNCGARTAWYYCDICKLWDNDSNKSIYHCEDCGICRKGRGLGKDFFHCKTCATCMPISVENSHKCIERVSDCDCPICGEYMFSSPSSVVFMLCGHSIHKACYYEHMKSSYKCPICSKSTVNMETQFRNLDRAIDAQPMPPQFQDTKAMVSCNDCYAKSAVKYHWLGLKCAICDSYNTAQLSILSDPAVEVPTIEGRTNEDATPPAADVGASSSSMFLRPDTNRPRRHSSHVHPRVASGEASVRFSPYRLPQRIGRSVSPVRGAGIFDAIQMPTNMETEESIDEDELDFWGRDEPKRSTSIDQDKEEIEEEEEEDEESDLDSSMDDCEDEDGDEEDKFELFGHR